MTTPATASLALSALEAMDLGGGSGAFAIADFGAADGGTSIDLVRRLIERIVERAPGREVTVTYTDLPRNDFSALFTLLHGGRVRSYLVDHDDVRVFASGTSFYRRIFPKV